MNPPYAHDDFHGGSVPIFGTGGIVLSQEERDQIAKRKGICVTCGIKTHEVTLFKRRPLTNDHVWNGICIRHNRAKVPDHIYQAWEQKFKPRGTPKPKPPVERLRNARNKIKAATNFRENDRNVGKRSKSPGRPSETAYPRHPPRPPRADGSSDLLAPSSASPSYHNSNPNLHHSNSRGDSSSRIRGDSSSHNSSSHSRPNTIQLGSDINEDYKGGSTNEDAWQVVKALRDNRSNPHELKTKLHRLRNIGDNQAGSLYEVKEIMDQYRNDPRIMAAASGALWGVTAMDDDRKIEAADCGALINIVDALRNPMSKRDPDFVQWALGTLCCLTKGLGNKHNIAKAGAIEASLESLKNHPNFAGVFEWTIRLLYSLVYQYDDEGDAEYREAAEKAIRKNMITIEDSDGIPTILKAMTNHSLEGIAQNWAVKLLWRLQDRDNFASSNRLVQKIIDKGGISAMVKVLKARSTSPNTFEITAALLYNLLVVAGPRSSDDDLAECVLVVTRKMEEHSNEEDLQQSSCLLLTTLAPNCRLQFKEAQGIRCVVNAMTRFGNNLEILRYATRILWSVTYIPAFFDQAFLEDGVRAVEAAHRHHENDAVLLTASCGFIANVVSGSNLLDDIPFNIPLNALSVLGTDVDVADQAGRALGSICVKSPALTRRIVEANGIQFLVTSLQSVSSQVQATVVGALISISQLSDDYKRTLISAGCLEAAKGLLQSQTTGIGDKALQLMSSLVTSERRSPVRLPPDIFQELILAMRSSQSDIQLLQTACGVMRNLLVVSTPGSTSIIFDGIIGYMTDLINDRPNPVDLKRAACGVLWALTSRQTRQNPTNLSTMFRSVLGVMGLYRGEEQEFHSELQSIAAGALASITNCIRDNNIHIAPEDVEEIIAVMYMVMEYDPERVELLEKFLDALLNLSFVSEGVVIQSGGIVVVIDAMVEHEHSESVQEKGCSILALLSSSENLQVNLCIAETDGIDMIVSALATFTKNERLQVDACKALSHLSVDHESRMLIGSQGGFHLLVNAMNATMSGRDIQENTDLLEGACSALLNLSSDAEEQLLTDSNVIATVVELMRRHPDSARLQEKALGVLQNISMRNANAKRSIANAGGISSVTSAITEYMGSPTVLERAFTTMWSLAVLDSNQVEIANAGGISLVVNGMMANIMHDRVQKQACGCLCTLSSNSRNKTLIREAGGVDSIVYAMWAHYDSELLQIEACRALSSLAVNVQTNEVMIATDGEINAIISGMRRFPDSAKLQEHVCVALRNFMLSADNANLIRGHTSELRALLTRAAQRFPNRCSERAHQVLAGLG